MKRKLFGTLALSLLLFISSAHVFNYPKFVWTKTTHDFGEIKYKQPVSFEFEFTNTGQGFLVISNVEASCGCTVTEYTKTPVPPNGKGKVKATFDAETLGVFHKSLTITGNVEGGPEYLYIKGVVME